MNDAELLNAYVNGSESAFRELVERYVDFVYSAAFHVVRDSALAQESAQTVFLILSRKAGSLTRHPTLAGWLYRTACHTGAKALRAEYRRREREREAAAMIHSDPDEPSWEEIRPQLNEALEQLSESDRLAVLLRFFRRMPMREVGENLGATEAAAKMRVNRALEKLRLHLRRRGIICSSGGLALVLTNQVVSPAPAGLAGSIIASMPASAASLGLNLSWTNWIIVMSNIKTKTIIVTGIAGLALLTLTVHNHWQDRSAPEQAAETLTETGANNPAFSPAPGEDPGRFGQVSDGGAAVAGLPAVDLAEARRELAAALTMPLPRSGIMWPAPEVLEALQRFGNDKAAAFEFLKEAILDPAYLTDEGDPTRLVRPRAIGALGELGPDVAGVREFLWELGQFGIAGDPAALTHAFSSLKKLGFDSQDLPGLIGFLKNEPSPALRRFVPEAMAEVLGRDPDGAGPFIHQIAELLEHPDERMRIAAAGALAGAGTDRDPRIRELLVQALEGEDQAGKLMALTALSNSGADAAWSIPTLLDLAESTGHPHLRTEVWRAIGRIQPELEAGLPEVARVIGEDRGTSDLSWKVEYNFAAFDELITALGKPGVAMKAAERLGDWGPAAEPAIPHLLKALEGRHEVDRDKILEAIRQIDPQIAIRRVEADVMFYAVAMAEIIFDGMPDGSRSEELEQLLLARRMFRTWHTVEEVAALAKQLASHNAEVHRAFVGEILKRRPDLEPVLRSLR